MNAGWLIVACRGRWYMFTPYMWTPYPEKAFRFARKQDAETMTSCGRGADGSCRLTEV